MKTNKLESYSILPLSLIVFSFTAPASSQSITPANDGTGTTVTPQGNQFNIEGGTRNGANLFHSFDQFNVNSGQTANFLTTPDTRNILGRVTGGNASIINGLIQVTGGNSNLFLMNPAGIMFGPNASLNIPASFSVTTATGIGFNENNFWFNAMGTNDYSNLLGNPSGYRFDVSNPGAIVNQGNLNSGENLTLLGGTVINTGELSTTNGNITVAAVEGGSVLRISQPRHLLSLDIDSRIEDISNLNILSLPELLTGGEENNATSIIVNSNGELELTDNTIIADTPGNVFVYGNIDLSTQESESNFIVLANNDITVNNLIETAGIVELKAGRSININADIDTSVGNRNIDLFGNNDEMNIANRSDGKASINQLDGTTLNTGSGRINIELGNLGEVGDINLGNLTTTGQVLVNANGGNITRVSDNSLINAESILFQTSGNGGIGLIDAPLQLNVENLEAVSGTGGVFFDVGNVNIGSVSEDVDGIVTAGGDIDIKSDGDVTLTETISTIETVENNSEAEISPPSQGGLGGIEAVTSTENREVTGTSGSINIEATGDIVATGSGIKGGGESISLSATNITINDEFDETSGDADVKLEATNDITVEDIEDDVLEFLPGGGEIEFRADVDGDGVGAVEMLDNKADVGSDPNTFENGADTIKTNGRNLTIAGTDLVLGNIDTSSPPPVFSGGELLATIDVNEGGPIPAEGTEGTATFTFTVDGNLGTVENLDVRFSAAHTWDGDLQVAIESPQGQEVTLFSGVGGGGDNFQDTVLDDNASRNIGSGNAPFDGTYRPQGNLADFNGENPNGTWTLRVTDIASGDSGTLYRAGDNAPWGTATGTQLLLGTPLVESAGGRGNGNGGAINLEATYGDISVRNIRSLSETGDGGRIDLKANNNIMTGLMTSSSRKGNGGNINLNTISGNIDTFSLDTSSVNGNGGGISVSAISGDITTENLDSSSHSFDGNSGNGGAISVSAINGDITTANLDSSSHSFGGNSGNGGGISVLAQGYITTTDINSSSESDADEGNSGNGGAISVSAINGDISTTDINSSSHSFDDNSGDGGAISVSAINGDISTANLDSFSSSFSFDDNSGNGGAISVSAINGDISTANLDSSSFSFDVNSGNGGAISMEAGGDIITTADITSFSLSVDGNSGDGGAISVLAQGDITTTDINSSSESASDEGNSGDGGAISVSAINGDISTADLDSSSFVFDGNTGDGGAISVSAINGDISTDRLRSVSASSVGNTGNGGAISVSAQGDITTTDINSSSSSMVGQSRDGGAISLNAHTIKLNPSEDRDTEQLAINTFSVGKNASGNGGDLNITTNNLSNTEILTLSSHGKSGQVTIESQPQENLQLSDLSIITSKQVTIESPFGSEIQINVGATQGQSGDVFIIGSGNLNLNNVTIESDTKDDQDAGNVNITSLGNIILDNTEILSITNAQGNAGQITLETDQNILLTNSSRLQASTEATGNAGTINIQANNLNLDKSTSLITETTSAGNPGSINIQANTVDIGKDAQISATVVLGSTSTGDGGNITINTNQLNITGKLGIFAETEASANAGTLTLSPYENNPDLDINFSNDGFISASTSSTGNGGNIFITAPENIDISGQGFIAVETSGQGDAGIIDIQTDNLTISDKVAINASTTGAGNAGQININTTDFTLEKGTSLTTETNSAGKAGDITINSPTVTIGEKASISATALEKATNTETGGNISIFSNTLNISGELGIFAQTEGESPAGTLTLKPYSDNPDLDINFSNNGFISASTSSTGNGGNINIFAPETIDISGDGKITVETTGSGSAGDIEINTGSLKVTNGAEISANTGSNPIDASNEENGVGGNIIIEATEIVNLDNDGRLSVEARGAGKAGNIEIYSPEVNVTTNSLISADAREEATNREEGGNITIDTNTLNISSSEIFAQTQSETPAGTITLKPYNNNSSFNINLSNEGTISASTQSTGEGGNISIAAPETIDIIGDGQIVAGSNGDGKAGNIEINSQQLTIAENARIRVATREKSTNTEGGTISINANIINLFSSESSESQSEISAETESETYGGTITLKPYEENSDIEINFSNDSRISARTLPTATGNAGNINISAAEKIKISGDGTISAENSGAGRGGDITIEATESIDLRNLEISAESTPTSTGNAGEIRIETQELTIADGARIDASTEGTGNAGAINIDTQTFTLETGTSLTTETESAGKAGDITINSERLTIGKDAEISATAKEGATNTEAGGNITINANDVLISGILGIFAETAGDSPAGTLTFTPYRRVGEQGSRGVGEQGSRGVGEQLGQLHPDLNITFTENGFISARTFSTGDGGNINIFAPENINISGEGRITVETTGAGNAGIINIKTENLTIAENTTISAATSDSGDGGRINITPSQTFQLEGQIITETTGTGNGGIITINTGEMNAPNSTISAKSTDAGNAGEIDIAAQNNITTGIITSEANNTTETADGGDISIISEQGEINATQPIQSFSNRGNAGDVTLTAQNDITTNIISSHGQQQGGQITITSETGNIDTSNGEFLANYSGEGDAGKVTIEALQGNITTSDIYSFANAEGGQILLKAGGDINIINNSNIISASEPPEQEGERGSGGIGRGGDIILEAGNNINTTTARIYSGADVGDTGKIDIIADSAIETGQIDLASGFVREEIPVNNNFTLIPIPQGEATQGVAGNITLRSNNSTIDSTAGTINSRSPDGTGNISLNARDNITTGKLEASAFNERQPTRGGDVNIISQQGEINVSQAIETFSAQGTAGNVNIMAEGSVQLENILSQGTQQGGDITIDSRSENSINAQGALNTFSIAGTAGDVTLTSPGSITINSIRSDGMEQGGTITVESEIGNINSGGDIDSFSDQGIGGNVTLNAPESVNLVNVSSFGATESGDLIIQSRTATVNTGNVTTEAPAGSSGSIIINGEEVGTGDLSSIGTTSAGEINVEATDGSIRTYDIEISSDGTIGDLILRATEDITTEDINQNAGEGDANINIESGEDQTTGDITQTAENDTNNIQIAEGDITTGDVTQTAGNDTNNIQIANGNQNIGNVTQTAGNDTNNIQIADGNQNTNNISGISDNNNSITNLPFNQDNSQTNNNTHLLNNSPNNTTTNPVEINISTITPSNNDQTTNTATAKEKIEESINNTTDTEQILKVIDTINTNPLTVATGSDQVVKMLEENRTQEYSDYFGEDFNQQLLQTKNVRDILTDMAKKTGKESAVIYINSYAEQLQIILYTKFGQPIIKTIPEAHRQKLMEVALEFRVQIATPTNRYTDSYLSPAQQLYDWFIAPISAELKAANIETLLFSMDEGLRTLPVAALHDGEQFLIEKYSLSLIPSVSLMDTNYRPLQNTRVLAMGASEFVEQNPLPAVPLELETIAQQLWQGNMFLNEDFTLDNLVIQKESYPYPIIHLATHADFLPGKASNSYIQLWGTEQIKLDKMRELGWNEPAVELLVLSACRTAIGDRNAELGFAGLAIAAGVKSALASVWYVNDEGTLGLMTEFYTHLNDVKIKAEALRRAQLAMLRGKVAIAEGELRGSEERRIMLLPPELENIENHNLSHPYYWAGFTMVGSPW